MDGDDISDPMRFEKQLNFLSSYPEISIVGTFSNVIDTNGVFQYHMKKPIHDRDIKKNAFKFLTLSHNTSMFYRNIYNSVGPYRETYQYCEDQDFIYRVLLSGYK